MVARVGTRRGGTLNVLRGEEPVQAAPEAPALPEVEEEAMKAYRKRMADEARPRVEAGTQPAQHRQGRGLRVDPAPRAVRPGGAVLAARGQLEATGHGFYKRSPNARASSDSEPVPRSDRRGRGLGRRVRAEVVAHRRSRTPPR